MSNYMPGGTAKHPYKRPIDPAYFADAPKATGATAGIPGTFTPAGSGGVNNLAGMTGVTASPATTWTIGQYVRLNDNTNCYWNGTAWVAGIKP